MHSRPAGVFRCAATCGAKALIAFILLLTLSGLGPRSLEAAPQPMDDPKAEADQTQAEPKLDKQLRRRSAASTGESHVIVALTDGHDDADVVRGFGARRKPTGPDFFSTAPLTTMPVPEGVRQ
jgi:hypothetical protein